MSILTETIPLWVFMLLLLICIGICIEWRISERRHESRINELERRISQEEHHG